MKVLVTGGFGNVGRSVVNACLRRGDEVVIFESPSAFKRAGAGLKSLIRNRWGGCSYVFGDIRSREDVEKAFSAIPGGPDAVIHLAALIPPAADKNPARTREINLGGTMNVIAAGLASVRKPRVVLASSIAIYGDRLSDFWIQVGDALEPTDVYAETKIRSEALLRESGLDFSILRLSYVVWAKWLPFDPLLFAMPPETRIEIIHTEDAGRAFAAAAESPDASGKTFDIGGGALCRTTFRAYIDRIFRYYGLGDSSFLPDQVFAKGGFHCGWYKDSDSADAQLRFRRKTLEDYYEEVRWETRFIRPLAAIASPFVRKWLMAKSPLRANRNSRAAIHSPGQFRLSKLERR